MNGDAVASRDDDDDDDADITGPLAILSPPPEDGGGEEEDDPAEPDQLEHHRLRSVNATIAIRQLPSRGLSFQLWPAATTLLNLLDSHVSDPAVGPGGGGVRRDPGVGRGVLRPPVRPPAGDAAVAVREERAEGGDGVRDGSPEAVEEGLGLLPEGEEGVRRGGDPHRQAVPGVEDRGRRLPVQLEEEKDRE